MTLDQMKKYNFLLIGLCLVFILNGCTNKTKKSEIDCSIGRLMVSRDPNRKIYNIYVALILKNYTKHIVCFPIRKETSNQKGLILKSCFRGVVNGTKINLIRIDSNSKILPNDSIKVLLYCPYFKPDYDQYKTDSMSFEQIKNIQVIYEYDLNNRILDDTIRSLKIKKPEFSKFVELKNNINYREAFDLDKMRLIR